MGFSGLLPIVRTLKLIGIACEHPHVCTLSWLSHCNKKYARSWQYEKVVSHEVAMFRVS